MNKAINNINSNGAAIVEFIISLIFIVPIFLSLPVIAKFISIKQKNIESGRYALWERTIWAKSQGQWKDDENVKHDSQIVSELYTRFYGNQVQRIASNNSTENNYWRGFNNVPYIETSNKKRNIILSAFVDYSPIKNRTADELAYKGFVIENATLEYGFGECDSENDINNDKGLNLGAHTYYLISVSVSIDQNIYQDFFRDLKNNKFESVGGILSNAWTAPKENIFKERVSSLVFDNSVRCISKPAQILSMFPLYKEGRLSNKLGEWNLSTVHGRSIK